MKALDGHARLLFTSRSHIDFAVEFVGFQRIHISAKSSDLETYLSSAIQRNHRFQKRVMKDAVDMQADIVNRVIEKASGM